MTKCHIKTYGGGGQDSNLRSIYAPDLQSTKKYPLPLHHQNENHVTASLVQVPLATWLLPHIQSNYMCFYNRNYMWRCVLDSN